VETLLSTDGSLVSLFIASFLAATFVPFSSEAALFAVLKLHPEIFVAAILVATAGNTAGGMLTYGMGRWLAQKKPLKHLEHVERWGAPVTALGWLPFIGEALCLAAGWLKLHWPAVLLWQFAGRGARYWVVAQGSLL
jgi:membrane protein YqaA with SNARE-associated domain